MPDITWTFPHDTDIVGYTYETEQYCRACMYDIVINEWKAFRTTPEGNTEVLLDLVAASLGIDRQDEYSFNSCRFPDSTIPVFPKVIFEGQICQEDCGDDSCDHEAAQCGHDYCGTPDCGRLCEK